MSHRTINPRGQGSGLREEILRAAERLLARSDSRGEITLRAIAREAGIAAPSIYPHFADRDAILDAVVSRTFAQLEAVCSQAALGADTGEDHVRAVCRAYAGFAHEKPGEYRILFERSASNLTRPARPYPEGIRAFELLVTGVQRMVSDGTSSSRDPARDAQALWAGLHGLITLIPATPGFPWRPSDALIERLIDGLSATEPASRPPGDSACSQSPPPRRDAGSHDEPSAEAATREGSASCVRWGPDQYG